MSESRDEIRRQWGWEDRRIEELQDEVIRLRGIIWRAQNTLRNDLYRTRINNALSTLYEVHEVDVGLSDE